MFAKGKVRTVFGNARPDSVWNSIELPALKNNFAVTMIIGVGPVSGACKVLWP